MSARLMGAVDIIGGFLLIISRTQYPSFATVFLGLGITLIVKGLYSML